jgi:signal transduction histidine kinase
MGKRDDENRESLLSSASTYTLTAIEEIRKLSKILITPLIKEKGLTDSIKGLTKEIMLVHPIQILFTAKDFIEAGFSDKFKLNIFRIVQEQINNTLKHAQAKKININIEDNYGKLLISIADDGIGFDTSKRRTGIGITNIKSRSELYNGTMLLNSEQGKGTTLSITFNKTDLLLNNHNESNS